jgi:hypothetical protein
MPVGDGDDQNVRLFKVAISTAQFIIYDNNIGWGGKIMNGEYMGLRQRPSPIRSDYYPRLQKETKNSAETE